MTGARSRCGRGVLPALAGLLVGMAGAGASLAGQHVAPPARGQGATLPEAYFQRLTVDPTAFTLPNGLFRTDAAGTPQRIPQVGTKGMLVIPALFSDSPEPHVSREVIQTMLFDGPAPRGTLTEAYLEMSRGKLEVLGTVAPWVRTSLTRAEVVGSTQGLGGDARVGPYLVEALRLADPDVDFAAFDNDGPDGVPNSGDDDGVVDAMAFEFIEVAASCGGPGIWPHLWGIAPQNRGEPYYADERGPDGTPIRVDAYIVQSAVDCGGGNPQDAATIAHEFGHVLGLPDYYHPTAAGGAEGRRWVLGCWELMAAGSWGCGPHGSNREPYGPAHMSAFNKEELSWLDFVDVGEVWDEEFTLEPVQASGEALRLPLDDFAREFIIVEYRTQTGFDGQLPAEGLLLYHEDLLGALRPNPTSGAPYLLSLLEQDDNRGLVRNTFEGGNRGEAGDAWGVAGAVQSLHMRTTPSLLLNATATSTRLTIHEMSVSDGTARLRLSTGKTPRLIAPADALEVEQVAPFERRVRIAGGYMPYQASGSYPAGVTATAEGDEVVLKGSVTGPGPFELDLRITDAKGSSADLAVPLTAGEWVVAEDRLLQPFLRSGATPLTGGELTYLDFRGNGNGRYDVGDLRAWMRLQAAKAGS